MIPDLLSHACASEIDALLPQTQCRQCGHAGCRPYAEAIAGGRADINRCPPGGEELVQEIAALLGVAAKPLDPAYGPPRPHAVAVIDERACIGCTLCIKACPVDAIVGASRLMHTVIAAECTGCELCLAPCPVDCIRMVATGRIATRGEKRATAARARRRFESRVRRVEQEKAQRALRSSLSNAQESERKKRAAVERARARARARLGLG